MEPKRKRLRRKHISPEVGSLYDILHDHSGVSLFVLPICWTDLHTRLLGCRFAQLPPQKTPTPSTNSSPRRSPRTPPTVVNLGRDLDTLMTADGTRPMIAKCRAMRSILSTLFPKHLARPKPSADLDMRFGGRFYPKAVRCQDVWKQPDASAMSFDSATTWTSSRSTNQLMSSMTVTTSNDAPLLAYINRSHLNHVRNNCFRILSGPNRSYNGPVHRLQMLRSKNLVPKNIDEDHYLIAIMIAMAQQSVYGDMFKGTNFNPRDVRVRVLTVSEEDNAFLVYSAIIPKATLMMFHEPDKAPKGDTQIHIDYTPIPIWPVLGLKERLGTVLGSELVGGFDGISMDTYEDELTPVPELISPKRRRDVLSEVFNGSFSEDRESDYNGDGLGKRRRLEEGRVGVVR